MPSLEVARTAGGSGSGGGVVATTVLVMGEAAAFVSATCPSGFTISSPFFHEQGARAGNVKRIHQGLLGAGVLTAGTGWAAGRLVGSWLPLVGGIAAWAALGGWLEWCMRHPATSEGQE